MSYPALSGWDRPNPGDRPPYAPHTPPSFGAPVECPLDSFVASGLQPGDDFRVDLVQDSHRMTGPLSALRRGHAGREPGGHARVPKVVRPPPSGTDSLQHNKGVICAHGSVNYVTPTSNRQRFCLMRTNHLRSHSRLQLRHEPR